VGRARPFLNRGAHYLERERPELAYADFERASAFGDTQGAAGFNLGMSLQMLRRHAEALKAFDRAEALGFKEPALYYHRGESLFALGRYADAFQSYTESLARSPAADVAEHTRLRRAEAAVPAGRYAEAVSDFTALLAKKPGDYRLMGGLGMAEVGRGNPSTALPLFDKLLAIKPTAGAHYGRAMAHLAAGNKPAALSDLDKAMALEPTNASYRSLRAQIASQN
jgi:tetratricopeptide (TPR) repeat protein